MPEVSRFYGIIIRMFFNDHEPPHFHAVYRDDEALLSIDSFDVLRGRLPPRALTLVREWATIHQDELRACWREARAGRSIARIEPLD